MKSTTLLLRVCRPFEYVPLKSNSSAHAPLEGEDGAFEKSSNIKRAKIQGHYPVKREWFVAGKVAELVKLNQNFDIERVH